MAGDFMKVTFPALDAGAAALRATFSQLEGEMTDLNAKLQPMLAHWSGAANAAYVQVQTSWNNAQAEMNTIINQLGTHVTNANENYQAGERSNVNRFA